MASILVRPFQSVKSPPFLLNGHCWPLTDVPTTTCTTASPPGPARAWFPSAFSTWLATGCGLMEQGSLVPKNLSWLPLFTYISHSMKQLTDRHREEGCVQGPCAHIQSYKAPVLTYNSVHCPTFHSRKLPIHILRVSDYLGGSHRKNWAPQHWTMTGCTVGSHSCTNK